jgi:hypothetical protein
MTKVTFQSAQGEKRFGLDWDNFYQALDVLLVADAYDRYEAWMRKHRKGDTVKRKLVVVEEVDDNWARGMTTTRSKKQKLEISS